MDLPADPEARLRSGDDPDRRRRRNGSHPGPAGGKVAVGIDDLHSQAGGLPGATDRLQGVGLVVVGDEGDDPIGLKEAQKGRGPLHRPAQRLLHAEKPVVPPLKFFGLGRRAH